LPTTSFALLTADFRSYKKAYQSMKACPLKFDHPKEAIQLNGLGPKLCDRLTDKLKAHCTANGLPMPELVHAGSKRKSDDEASEAEKPAKKPRKTKPYVPTLRSGAYGLVLGLATLDEDASIGLTKAELIVVAQPHSDSSFSAPSDPTKFYTAWNSMKTLVEKDLVYEHGRPLKKYLLTDEGWDVARRIKGVQSGTVKDLSNAKDKSPAKAKSKVKPTASTLPVSPLRATFVHPRAVEVLNIDSSPERPPRYPQISQQVDGPDDAFDLDFDIHIDTLAPTKPANTTLPTFTPIILPPGSFTVRLVLDTREVRTKKDRDYISSSLATRGLDALTRALPLGDVLWIAQIQPSHAHLLPGEAVSEDGQQEIMLSHIIERKRLDDLIGSIKDGRFHEQKFRLSKSGVEHVTYIIEAFSVSDDSMDKYGEAVESAIASMQVVNGYFVKQTKKLDDTIAYLAAMTEQLREQYEKEELRVIPSRVLDSDTYLKLQEHLQTTQPGRVHHITYPSFGALCSKSEAMTLRDVFLKMLMCTRGITGEKAVEIQKRWGTPRGFVEAFEARNGEKERNEMVSERLGGVGIIARKKVARQLSKKVAEIWG
jgi:crossover junction endonuclease MUS81